MSVKEQVVGTAAGRWLVRGRSLWRLFRVAFSDPERGGMVFQDECASRLLPRLCTSGGVFVDVGAHLGSVIAEVRRWAPGTRIIAIEAVPEKARRLAGRFKNVTVHNCAAGERSGEVSFFVDQKRPGYSSLLASNRPAQDLIEIRVAMQQLDQLIDPDARVEVVKIDVVGAELSVLRGAVGLVSRCRPIVVFESGLLATTAAEYPLEARFNWFAEREYELLVPNRVAHEGPGLSRDGFMESHFYPRRTINYFGVPRERRAEVRERARAVLHSGREA